MHKFLLTKYFEGNAVNYFNVSTVNTFKQTSSSSIQMHSSPIVFMDPHKNFDFTSLHNIRLSSYSYTILHLS